jgi:hypothetical protein
MDMHFLERIGEEMVMVNFKVLPSHSPGVTEGKPRKSSVSVVCAAVKIQAGHHLHTSQNCCHLLGSILKIFFLNAYVFSQQHKER